MAKKEGTTGKCQAITMDKWENKRLALFGFASFRSSAENAQKIFSIFIVCLQQPADNRKPFTIGPASPRIGCLLRKRSHTQVARRGFSFGSDSTSARFGFDTSCDRETLILALPLLRSSRKLSQKLLCTVNSGAR